MPRAAPPIIVLTAALGVFGCGPAVRSTPFNTFPERPPEHPVQIYSTRMPSCDYEEVGLVSARQRYRWFTSMSEVLEALKQRARAMGGDAVVGVAERSEVSGSGGEEGVTVSSSPVLSGTVVRFTETGCAL